MSLFDLQPGPSGSGYRLVAPPGLCVGPAHLRFLFGGVGLAAAVEAMQRATQAPLVWATAQYLGQAAPGSKIDIDVTLSPTSRTQVQAQGMVGDQVIFFARGALGSRSSPITAQWVSAPPVLPPEQCAEDFDWPQTAHALRERIEIRHALPAPTTALSGEAGLAPGRSLLWIRPRDALPLEAPLIAILADFATAGITATLGPGTKASSLDNTLRICRPTPTRWLLCDTRIHGAYAGFAHGEMRMFADGGDLIAVASQSMILRAMA